MKLLTSRSITVQITRAKTLLIWIDSPDRSVNILDANVLSGISKAISYAESNPESVRVVMFCSRKPTGFFAGADVHAIANIRSTSELREVLLAGSTLFDRIAELKATTIAAIDGVCLGGGLELALACDFRIASNASHTRMGLPEVKLGLLPGWGGTQRLPRLIGLKNALPLILKGSTIDAAKARQLGLVDKLFEREHWDSDVARFAAYIASVGWEREPRDRTWSDWFVESTLFGRHLARRSAIRQIEKHRNHHPALEEIIDAVTSSSTHRSVTYGVEHKAFERLLFSATAQNMLSIFTDRDRARKIGTWIPESNAFSLGDTGKSIASPRTSTINREPNDTPQPGKPFEQIGIMGAGAMGAGIGVLAAKKGYAVVFREVSSAAAEAGWDRIEKLLQHDMEKGRLSEDQYIDIIGRITVATDLSAVFECQLVVEAVLEIESVKRELFNTLDRILPPESIFASNTSSLGIRRMGSATSRPSRVAGLHFFNPVEQMELVEIVRTPHTSDETAHKLLLFAKDLGKTPIVTADSPGFLVNRILFPYLGEAVRMALDGTPFHVIDSELTKFGMPMGPLELLDQVGIDIAAHVAKSLRDILPESKVPADVLEMMVGKGWLGKKSGLGFYDYKIADKKVSNLELLNRFGKGKSEGIVDYRADGLSVIQRRLVYAMMNETFRCLEEQVVAEPWVADLGLILGCGFAPQTGGPLRLVDAIGPRTVHHNMTRLARLYGDRYRPSDYLSRLAPNDQRVYESIDYCRVPFHPACRSRRAIDTAATIS